MIRQSLLILAALAITVAPVSARSRHSAAPAEDADTAANTGTGTAKDAAAKGKAAHGKNAKTDGKAESKTDAKGGKGNKPVQVGTYGDWGAFTAQGKGKTCYALAQPRERAPANLKRDSAYIFISNRPSENVRNEVSIIMGFAMKDNSDAKAEIGNTSFDLICKGTNAWVKNAARESELVEALKRGSKLVIKASSVKGNVSTDTYSLAGLSDALARIQKECP